MRIIAGEKRGCQIVAPKGRDTRPTLDRIKESLFGIIQFDVAKSRVLDLFAGSGNLGLEALSRGAQYAAFCDVSRESIRVIRANIEKLGVESDSEVFACDCMTALSALMAAEKKFDIVFLDPPYASALAEKAIARILELDLLARDGMIVAEHAANLPPAVPEAMEVYDVRKYGDIAISFMRRRT